MAIKVTQTQLKKMTKIAEGGEATIYEHDGKTVLKIFKAQSALPTKQKKVEAMLVHKSSSGFVILPEDVVLSGNKFIGYQMPNVHDGEPLHSYTKARFVRDHGLTNQDALQIMVQISKAIDEVHSIGYVIGDVSDNNFLASLGNGHPIYLIDTDSWGIGGYEPDAYTETFAPPEAYNGTGRMTLDVKTDNYGLSVLAFNVLTRIHPFGGTYQKSPNMNTVERMKKKISLLGKHDIVYNKNLFNWSWMSPDLQRSMQETFEGKKRETITGELEDQLQHSKYCGAHKIYYYDRYTDCPLCAGVAKLKKVLPKVVVSPAQGPKVVLVFSHQDVHMMLDENSYIGASGKAVYIQSGKSLPRPSNAMVHYASRGRYLVAMFKGYFTVTDADGKQVAEIERMFGSSYDVNGASVMYVDRNGQVHKLLLSEAGLQNETIFQASNPLLALNDNGGYMIVSRYADRIMVSYKHHDVEIVGPTTIKEYAIKYDSATKTWLFVYEMQNGAFRTMVFGEKGKEHDNTSVRYTAAPLSNVCYHNGTVYDPGFQAFTGTNLKKDVAKIFQCNEVDETCALKFKDGAFTIIKDTSVYRFG